MMLSMSWVCQDFEVVEINIVNLAVYYQSNQSLYSFNLTPTLRLSDHPYFSVISSDQLKHLTDADPDFKKNPSEIR